MDIAVLDPSDHDEWLRLRLALWPEQSEDEHRADMRTWLARADTEVLVARRGPGAGLGGFAEVGARSIADNCRTSPVAYLEGWYIDPDLRRHGLGAALVRAAEDWARRCGYRELASDAELANTGSQAAHRALGFVETSRCVLYLKDLDEPRE